MGNSYFEKRVGRKKFFPNGIDLVSFEGTVNVNSNATSATVSTTNVKSNSNIQATPLTTVAGSQFAVSVGSRVDGVSFAVNIPADAAIQHTVGWAILG